MNRLRQPGDSDYDVLGLSPGATDEEIEIAFRQLIDGEGYRVGVPLNRQWLRAHQIKHAHASLSDPEKRRAYDEWLSRADREPLGHGSGRSRDGRIGAAEPKAEAGKTDQEQAGSSCSRSDWMPFGPFPVKKEYRTGRQDQMQKRRRGRHTMSRLRQTCLRRSMTTRKTPACIHRQQESFGQKLGFGRGTGYQPGVSAHLIGVEWDRRPSTIEGTPEVTPDGRRASVAGRGNEVPVQEVSELIPKDMADARSPVDKKPAGIAPPAPKGPSLPAAAAEAREIAPIQKPPVDRSPAIKAARVAAVKPISPIGSAPQWIGGGPTDADNRRGQYQGTVALQVNVQPSGRVSNCAPVRGSGNAGLDRLTCRLVQQRARFIPARDPRGKRIVGQAYITFAWVRK